MVIADQVQNPMDKQKIQHCGERHIILSPDQVGRGRRNNHIAQHVRFDITELPFGHGKR